MCLLPVPPHLRAATAVPARLDRGESRSGRIVAQAPSGDLAVTYCVRAIFEAARASVGLRVKLARGLLFCAAYRDDLFSR